MMVLTLMARRRQPWRLPRPGRLLETIQARVRAPQMARADVEQIVAAYDLRLTRPPENLPFGWRSHNLVLHTNVGKKVLKRYRAGWPATTIAYEHAILKHLQASGFPAPRLAVASENKTAVQQKDHFFALFDFLEGNNYAASFMLPRQRGELMRQAGATLARLHGLLQDFCPAGEHHLGYASGARQRDLAWHLERLPALSQRVQEVEGGEAREAARWLAAQQETIAGQLQRLQEKLAEAPLPRTVIHGDYGIHNLHFHEQGPQPVTVVDFELARREWRLVDLVSVLSRIGLKEGHTFIAAYQAALPEAMAITDEEWRLLPDVWQQYRLRGAVQYWHNYWQVGGARRLVAARKRVMEADWALQHRPELWDLRPRDGAAPAARPLRVMMVARLFYPWIGGAERQAQRLAQALMEADSSVELVTGWWFRGTPRRELVGSVPVTRNFTFWHSLDIKGLRKFSGYLYILTLLLFLWRRRRDYDVIHVHGLNYHAFAAVLGGRWFGRKVLVKLANSGAASDIKKMQQDKQLALARVMLPTALQADCFVALNKKVVSELLAAGVLRRKIVEAPNGIDVQGFETKESYELHEPATLVYVGRLHEQKGLDTLLHAFRILCQKLQSGAICLRLVGDGPARQRLQALAEELGIAPAVTFVGITHDVAAELSEADVFVLPSRAEGLSNALLEAMSCALPVVVSDVAGNVDVVEPGKNGLLFDVDDPQSLADALLQMLQQPTLRQTLGRAARQTVAQNYSLDTVAGRYTELYRALVTSNSAFGWGERNSEVQHDDAI